MKNTRTLSRLLLPLFAVLWVALIYRFSLQPGTESTQESNFFLFRLLRVIPWVTELMVRKTAHFAEFLVLGALLYGSFRAFSTPRAMACLSGSFSGLLIALGDETIQLSVPGRSGSPKDVFLDFAGICAGILLCVLLRKKKKT